jgi:hypothetical protein
LKNLKTNYMKLLEMNPEQFSALLDNLNACEPAKEWAKGKSAAEVIETCYRGDWLLWIYKKVAPTELQRLTLAKAHCANTVRHLMRDGRSIKAVDAAIAFGEGRITREELNAAAAADAAAYAAYAAYAAAAYAADADAARTKNRLLTANICRQYLMFAEVEVAQ